MPKTATLSIRVDPKIKGEAETLYSRYGLSLGDAVNVFLHQSLNVGGLPFDMRAPHPNAMTEAAMREMMGSDKSMTIADPDISDGKAEHRLQVYMMRHGKPRFPDGRSYVYGWTDYPLSALGREQAKHIGGALSSVRFDRVISSDLSRAAETADIVAGFQPPPAREVERDPELREINMGEWDGKAVAEIKENYVDIFRERGLDLANVAAPGGETFARLRERGMKAFERITRTSEGLSKILLVAHGAFMWSIISGIFGMALGDIFRFGLDHCAVHLVEYRPTPTQWGNHRLIRYNWRPDLAAYSDDLV